MSLIVPGPKLGEPSPLQPPSPEHMMWQGELMQPDSLQWQADQLCPSSCAVSATRLLKVAENLDWDTP